MRAGLFPGQGSQRSGMGEHFHNLSAAAREVYDLADEVLRRDVRALCFRANAETLRRTENAQVAIVVTSLAALALTREAGLEIDAAAGHSVGEIAALVAAGALEPSSAIELAATRGALMGSLPPIGGMTAIIGLDDDELNAICEDARDGGVVAIAAFNADRSSVVSGTVEAIESVAARAASAGGRVRRLDVSHAFHSSLIESIHDEWASVVEATPVRNPVLPLIANVSAEVLMSADEVRNELIGQVTMPVRWRQTVEALSALGVTEAVEIGDSKVIGGLARGGAAPLRVASMGDPRALRAVLSGRSV